MNEISMGMWPSKHGRFDTRELWGLTSQLGIGFPVGFTFGIQVSHTIWQTIHPILWSKNRKTGQWSSHDQWVSGKHGGQFSSKKRTMNPMMLWSLPGFFLPIHSQAPRDCAGGECLGRNSGGGFRCTDETLDFLFSKWTFYIVKMNCIQCMYVYIYIFIQCA